MSPLMLELLGLLLVTALMRWILIVIVVLGVLVQNLLLKFVQETHDDWFGLALYVLVCLRVCGKFL